MTKLQDISVLDKKAINKAIFGRDLISLDIKNTFSYKGSAGYYDKNEVSINIGFRFLTPTGRLSKIFPVTHICLKEEGTKSGETNWIAFEETLDKLKDKINHSLSRIDYTLAFFEKSQRENLAEIVISYGSGGSEIFLLERKMEFKDKCPYCKNKKFINKKEGFISFKVACQHC